LYLTEFAEVAIGPAGRVDQVAQQPPLVADQTVSIGAGSLQSAAFNAKTRIVRVHADVVCSVLFGTNPTALATSARMAAGQTEYFGVPLGQGFKVAVITNT
jgi:hypothetical protein